MPRWVDAFRKYTDLKIDNRKAASALRSGGVVVFIRGKVPSADVVTISVVLDGTGRRKRTVANATVSAYFVQVPKRYNAVVPYPAILSSQLATALHLGTETQKLVLGSVDDGEDYKAVVRLQDGDTLAGDGTEWAANPLIPINTVFGGLVGAATLAVAMLAIALAAVYRRFDRHEYQAVGTHGQSEALNGAIYTFIVSLAGALVGTSQGYVPGVYLAQRHHFIMNIKMPWELVPVLVLGLPLIAAASTYVTLRLWGRQRG